MDTAEESFRKWFADVLRVLSFTQHSGFTQVMVSLSLLERYLRERSGVHEKTTLDDGFYIELIKVFPQLSGLREAKKFWKIFRHGLLHQVAFRVESDGRGDQRSGGLSDSCEAVLVTQDGDFWVNPVKFSEKVVCLILDDFSTFLGRHSPSHPLATVGSNDMVGLGTASPEMWKKDVFKKMKRGS